MLSFSIQVRQTMMTLVAELRKLLIGINSESVVVIEDIDC